MKKDYASDVIIRNNYNTFLQLAENMFQLYLFVFLYFRSNWQLVHGQGKKYGCLGEIISARGQNFYTCAVDIDSERARPMDVQEQLFCIDRFQQSPFLRFFLDFLVCSLLAK